MTGPLHGVKVVELGVWVAGPAAAGILADWGADVVKIEPRTGDPARTFGRMLGLDVDVSPPFELDNRSKRSVVLRLEEPDDRDAALGLIDDADVFVTNIRPSALRRLGLDYAALAARRPRLVYGLITGYGSAGPDADRAAYDVAAFWARGGPAALLTPPGGDPPFQRGGMGDHSAGISLAGGICAALFARQTTGAGQLVSTSLYRQGVYTVGFDLNTYLMSGQSVSLGRRDTMGNPCMNNYTASDGRRFWIVGLQGDRHWPALCRAVDRPDWLTDPRYARPRDRAVNARELIGELDAVFATRALDEWAQIFDRDPEFFWSPVNTIEDILADEQFHAAGGIVEVPDGPSTVPMVASPVDFGNVPAQPTGVAPRLGEHTAEVLDELRGRTGSG